MVARFFVSNRCRAARLSAVGFASFLAVFVMTSPPVHADVTWTLPAGQAGDWSDSANWSAGVTPTGADTAYVANGGTATITLPGNVCDTLSLGGSAGSGFLLITGGTLSATNYEF